MLVSTAVTMCVRHGRAKLTAVKIIRLLQMDNNISGVTHFEPYWHAHLQFQ